MKTFVPTKECQVPSQWHIIDAEGKVLGRVAAQAAVLLRGKHKPQYTPFMDCGDHVIIVNAAKARVTGSKSEDKRYYRHTGYPGGIKETSYRELVAKHPTRAMEMAITGMLPNNRLGRKLAKKFRVYAGEYDNKYAAQNPQPFNLD